MLNVDQLCCVRGDRVLIRELDFALTPGELLHLKGHNGSGKTTLLRALAGLLLPESGDILWQGQPIRKLREEYSRHLLFLGHLNGIKGDLTAVENLRDGLVWKYFMRNPEIRKALDKAGLVSTAPPASNEADAYLRKLAAPVPGVGVPYQGLIAIGLGIDLPQLRNAIEALVRERCRAD